MIQQLLHKYSHHQSVKILTLFLLKLYIDYETVCSPHSRKVLSVYLTIVYMYLLCHFYAFGRINEFHFINKWKKNWLLVPRMCVCVCTPYTIRFSCNDITYFCSRNNRRYTYSRHKALF